MASQGILSEKHRSELIGGSGLTSGIIEARGYRSVKDPGELLKFGFSKAQTGLCPALLLPIWWGDKVVHCQIKPDSPRVPHGAKKPAKYETPAGSQPHLDCHPLNWDDLRNPAKPLLITEGIKKADAAASRGIVTIGLIGVYGFLGRNEHGGVCSLAEWDDVPLRSAQGRRKVFICFDSDAWINPRVLDAMVRLGKFLRRRGADVAYLHLPQTEGGPKVGLDDWFLESGHTPQELFGLIASPERAIPVHQRDLSDLVQDGLDALVRANDPPFLYTMDSEIASVVVNERGIASIQRPSANQIRLHLAESCRWVDKKGSASPPKEVAEMIHGKRNPPFPPIAGITKGPLLSRSGQITASYGYCPESHYWMDVESPAPFQGGARRAAEWIKREIFSGFDFESESDWAHTLSLCLLPVVRPVIEGPTPLHLIGAPVQGSGKGLLGKCCLMMTQGDKIAMTPMSSNEEETRKRITSLLITGKNYLFIDNITQSIASAALSVLLTSGEWLDRPLGTSRLVQLEVNQTLVATANNPVLDKDMLRRSLRIWIDPGVEHPEDREGFKPIERWIITNRAQIQGALVAIVAEWAAKGMPAGSASYGSFEDWAKTMSGLMETCEVGGFLGNVHRLREQSGGIESAWSRFYQRWDRVLGARETKSEELYPLFIEDDELASLLRDGSDRAQRTQLGIMLSRREGVVCAGLRIRRGLSSHNSGSYRMEAVEARQKAQRLIDISEDEPLRV